MSDDPNPASAQAEEETPEQRKARGYANLRPAKKGDVLNKTGTNGWRRAQARLAAFVEEVDKDRGDGKATRWQHILETCYTSALVPGLKGAPDRKLLIEQVAGRAKQQVELGNTDGSPLRVVAFLPDNGRGPGDPDPDDGEPGAADPG